MCLFCFKSFNVASEPQSLKTYEQYVRETSLRRRLKPAKVFIEKTPNWD